MASCLNIYFLGKRRLFGPINFITIIKVQKGSSVFPNLRECIARKDGGGEPSPFII